MDDADPEESSATTADEIPAHLRLSNPALPDELIVEEILARLPAKAVLRFRAACRAWRSGSSTPRFLRTYYDRKVSLPLVAFSNSTKNPDTLDTIDVLAGAEHRRPVLAFSFGNKLHTSWEGLLLISHTNGRYNIYNPATRQCLSLPELTSARCALLYSSPSTNGGVEYHVLFWKGRPAVYHVMTLGSSAQPRRIDPPEGPEDFTKVMASGNHCFRTPSVMFKGALHWDYQAEVWTLKYCIQLAMVDRLRLEFNLQHMVLSNNGDLLISSAVGSTMLIQCDAEGNLIKEFSSDSWKARVMGLWYKESIARHSFFER
ncbi:hypothetical protein ACQ4PT_041575 [Festuca glaucescens]